MRSPHFVCKMPEMITDNEENIFNIYTVHVLVPGKNQIQVEIFLPRLILKFLCLRALIHE